VDEADEEFVAVAPGCADAAGAEADCGEAGREPAQKSTKRKTTASLKMSFVTASPSPVCRVSGAISVVLPRLRGRM